MRFEDTFSIPIPLEDAWQAFQDLEMVGGCMPGATLTNVDGDHLEGTVRLRVGPMALTYRGVGEVVSRDSESTTMRLRLQGKDLKGASTASAEVTARLVDSGSATDVAVATELALTGRPAQFGRGVLADVSSSLMRQFAESLEQQLQAGQSEAEDSGDPGFNPDGAPAKRADHGAEGASVDGLRLAMDVLGARRVQIGVAAASTVLITLAVRHLHKRARRARGVR
jgi:carbon monoxide dehydrogenase subunit G